MHYRILPHRPRFGAVKYDNAGSDPSEADMASRAIRRFPLPATFFAAAAGVYACAIWVSALLPRLADADWVAVGMTLDLVVVVPLLYYLLLVRGRGWRLAGVIPVALAGFLAAMWIVPEEHRGLITALEWIAVPLELCLLGLIGRRAATSIGRVRSRAETGDDAFDAIRAAALDVTGTRWAAELLSQEIASFYYAFGSWRTPLPAEGAGYSSYRSNSYAPFFAAITMAIVIETVALHLVVQALWSSVAAWILTGLGLYSLIWLIGDFQALRLRRTTLTQESVEIRLGTRWEITIPRSDIAGVELLGKTDSTDARPEPRAVKLVLLGQPDVEIRLNRPVTVRGLFGLRKTTSILRLQVDDAADFARVALQQFQH